MRPPTELGSGSHGGGVAVVVAELVAEATSTPAASTTDPTDPTSMAPTSAVAVALSVRRGLKLMIDQPFLWESRVVSDMERTMAGRRRRTMRTPEPARTNRAAMAARAIQGAA